MVTWYGTNNPDHMDAIKYGNSNDYIYGYPKYFAWDPDHNDNDTILGWKGNDHLYGGTGNDKLYGEQHNDSLHGGSGHDKLYGGSGHDWLDGWTGNDTLYGSSGNDSLLGYDGYDKLYGGSGNDKLYGEKGPDDLYGGTGVDKLYGGSGVDYFYFDKKDSGDIYAGKADTIYDFKNADQIWLKGHYKYVYNDKTPDNGEYSIWKKGSDWVVTWNAHNDAGYHDVLVKGDSPHGDISFY